MKKAKFLSVVLVISIMLSMLSLGTFAAQPEKNYWHKVTDGPNYINLLKKEIDNNSVKVNEKFKNASSYTFYDDLTTAEKALYDGIVNKKAGMTTSNGNFVVSVPNINALDGTKSLYKVIASIIDDVPELYWLLSDCFDIYSYSGENKLHFDFMTDYICYSSFSELKKEYNATVSAANNFTVTGETRYEKVKSIAKGICELAEYADITGEEDANTSKIFFPSSCLLAPYKTVCDGYSKAFKMICDANDIPSLVVVGIGYTYDFFGELSGGGHAWNYVQMDDGKWYAVDTTWMDNNPNEDDFFLVGSKTPDANGLAFVTTHVTDGSRFTIGYENITVSYPSLSLTAFDPNKEITPPVKVKTLGDVNADDNITIADAKLVLKAVANIAKLTAAQKTAADVNIDNNVTIADAKWILQAVAGMRTLAPAVDLYDGYVVPDLGKYFGVNCLKETYYNSDGDEVDDTEDFYAKGYTYNASEIASKGSIDNYCELLVALGYDFVGEYTQDDEKAEYYLDDENYVIVMLVYNDNGEIELLVYNIVFYTPSAEEVFELYSVPSFNDFAGVEETEIVYYGSFGQVAMEFDPDGATEIFYDKKAAKKLNAYKSLLAENGFVFDDSYKDDEDNIVYEYYTNEEVRTGLTLIINSDGSFSIFMYSIYIAPTYEDFNVPDIGEQFGINETDRTGDESEITYFYDLDDLTQAGYSLDSVSSFLVDNDFALVSFEEETDDAYGRYVLVRSTDNTCVFIRFSEEYADFMVNVAIPKTYETADIPNIGELAGIECMKIDYYSDSLDYFYNLSDLEASAYSMDDYIELLGECGYVFVFNDEFDEDAIYDYYFNEDIGEGISIYYYADGTFSIYLA